MKTNIDINFNGEKYTVSGDYYDGVLEVDSIYWKKNNVDVYPIFQDIEQVMTEIETLAYEAGQFGEFEANAFDMQHSY